MTWDRWWAVCVCGAQELGQGTRHAGHSTGTLSDTQVGHWTGSKWTSALEETHADRKLGRGDGDSTHTRQGKCAAPAAPACPPVLDSAGTQRRSLGPCCQDTRPSHHRLRKWGLTAQGLQAPLDPANAPPSPKPPL